MAAYAHMSWEEITLKCKANESFRREVQKTLRRVVETPAKAQMLGESVKAGTATGVYVYRDFLFQTEKEFEKAHSMKPGELGLETIRMPDETGTVISGVVLSDPDAPRKMRVWHQADVTHADHVHSPAQQMRSGQGRDMYDWFAADHQKVRPKCAQAGSTISAPTPAMLAEMVKRKVAERAAERERQAQLAALAAEAAAMEVPAEEADPIDEQAAENEDDDDDNDDDDSEDARPVLPSERLKKGKGKSKGDKAAGKKGNKGGGKGKKVKTASPKKAMRWLQPSRPSLTAAPSVISVGASRTEVHGGESQSIVSTADTKTKSTPPEKHEKHIEKVSLTKILAGKSLGDKLYHARRAAGELERDRATAAEAVLLRGHIAMAEQCQVPALA